MKHKLKALRERFWIALAWRMPRPLVAWCVVRCGTHGTTGQYSSTVVPELTVIEALRRWEWKP